MKKGTIENQENILPWWTWVLPIILLRIATEITYFFLYTPGGTFFYFPTAVGIILINWWGFKRVIPAMYINGLISALVLNMGPWHLCLLIALPQAFFVALSWYLFTYRRRSKYWLPDTNTLISFINYGICVPLVIGITGFLGISVLMERVQADAYMQTLIRSLLTEFISNFGLTLPVLYYFTPFLQSKKLTLEKYHRAPSPIRLSGRQRIEVVIIYSIILTLSFTIPFAKFWFVYGIFSLLMALRYGFGLAILTNTYIFFTTYILPIMLANKHSHLSDDSVINIYLGTSLLYLFSAIIGRVISEVTDVERKMVDQLYQLEMTNKELEITNKELDHFAYSVSHDLSAPLKSILGLVNISKISNSLDEHKVYFEKIESSVKKLDTFIHEILDYSRNKRQSLVIEAVNLKELCHEIIENLNYMEGISVVTFDLSGLSETKLKSDKNRLKIILNNIISNAIKYQRATADHQPLIKVSSRQYINGLTLQIEDNGEGMKPEVLEKLFGMFFRGTQKSKGSGLGLYIAKEAAEKIGSYISVSSTYGEGTIFTVELKNLEEVFIS